MCWNYTSQKVDVKIIIPLSLLVNILYLIPLTVNIDLIQHGAQFVLGGELSEGAHHPPQLLLRDRAVAVLVEQPERLAQLCTNVVQCV